MNAAQKRYQIFARSLVELLVDRSLVVKQLRTTSNLLVENETDHTLSIQKLGARLSTTATSQSNEPQIFFSEIRQN